MPKYYDIVIIGAGPAGATCALALKESGLKVAVIDKDGFPRDKICGDALPGGVYKILKSMSDELAADFHSFTEKVDIKACKIVSPNGKDITVYWHNQAYNSARKDFDFHLFKMMKKYTSVDVYEGARISKVEVNKELVHLNNAKDEFSFDCKLAIGCDGAQSVIARQLIDFKVEHKHYCGGIRAYFKNVEGIEKGVSEAYMLKGYLPGYFWIFPLTNDTANVGFGMLSEDVVKRQISLVNSFSEIIESHPAISNRFKNAEMVGEIKGFGLPLASRKVRLSGNRFMLTGDAGSLIDPLTGHGIDNAMLSGKLAASQAMGCFSENRFDEEFIRSYDETLYGKLWAELNRNTKIMRFLSHKPWLINTFINLGRNKTVKKFMFKVARL